MQTLIALGNPGTEYARTRHNAARVLVAAAFPELSWNDDKYARARVAEAAETLFVEPHAFMNESGTVLPFLMKEYQTAPETLVVAHDDLDLPIGAVRVSHDRGDGGHNGVKSIMATLGSKQFTRIRIGIAISGEEGKLHKPDVLGNFSAAETETLAGLAERFADIVETIGKEGAQQAMNRFN